jgi:predicted cupin superfamily sugar epimerase
MSISLAVNAEARQIISRLGMVPLPEEGGYFAPVWTSPERDSGGRSLGSAILFLITEEDFSALHRLKTDEIWHFHAGDPAELVRLGPGAGSASVTVLGPDVAGGDAPQAVVPGGQWQGARIRQPKAPGARGWALFGCTLSPAWDEREFELGSRGALLDAFPSHAELVRALTRPRGPVAF